MSLHTCSVCLATAVDSREVPCGNGHVFCLSCLQGLVTRAKTTEAFSFPCPCCRIHVDIPPGGVECFPSVTIQSESPKTASLSALPSHDLPCMSGSPLYDSLDQLSSFRENQYSSSRRNASTNSGQTSPYVQSAVNSPSHASIRHLLEGSQCQREHAESDSVEPQHVSPPKSPSPGRFSEYNLPVLGQGDDQTPAVGCPVHPVSGSPECRAPQTPQATPAADRQPSFKPYFKPGFNTESSSEGDIDEPENATPSSTISLEDDASERRSSDADPTDAGNRAVPHRPDPSPQMTHPPLPVIFHALRRAARLQQLSRFPVTARPVGPPGAYGFPRSRPGTANLGVPRLPTRSPVFGRFPGSETAGLSTPAGPRIANSSVPDSVPRRAGFPRFPRFPWGPNRPFGYHGCPFPPGSDSIPPRARFPLGPRADFPRFHRLPYGPYGPFAYRGYPFPPGYHRHPPKNRPAPHPAQPCAVPQPPNEPASQDEDTAEETATASKSPENGETQKNASELSEDLDMEEVMLVIAQMESQQCDVELSQQDIEAILAAQFDNDSQHSPVSGDSH